MKNLLWVASIFLLSNTALAIEESTIVVDYNKINVQACQQIETLEGPTGYRMMGPPEVLGSFKDKVRKKAEDIGATHIVWSYVESGLERQIYGKVYNCNSPAENKRVRTSKLLNY